MPPDLPVPASIAALPEGFRFGTVTAAYQVEGAVAEDGRGPSTWDTYAAEPGHIADGSTAAVAADHYHRVDEDVALLSDLGVRDYKFSVSWSRVLPTGRGEVNAAGLDFYDRLVDKLLAAGISPVATLHHWDLPQVLEDDGGWLNRSTADAFGEYAGVVGERLADRVSAWVPISEPAVMVFRGYALGEGAPGRRALFDALPAVHHALLGHGRAAIELRRAGAAAVGCANNHSPMWPASDDPADVGATKLFDALWNGLFLEPMLLGRYPGDLAMLLEDLAHPGDLATIRQPLDFYGINYYSPLRVAAAEEESETPFRFVDVLGHDYTDAGWAVVPEALREWLIMTRARFRAAMPPLVITECGASVAGEPDEHGVVDDPKRIEYLTAHIDAVAAAVRQGVDVRGFFVWSLLDSWEWQNGFLSQYGLVHVDRATQARTKKRSFQWYADVVAAHRRGS
ncbi:MAG TPA: GH1 family beta-glucosidase [Nocardioides sp.]|nr:GH1 family beta-glucosidase [Nocardioides sp.]